MAIDLSVLNAFEKSFPSRPVWRVRDDEWFQLTSPLDVDGVTVEGLRFTASAMRLRPDESVSFCLEYYPGKRDGRGGCFARVEWRALGEHYNKASAPNGLRLARITGTHVHPFTVNWSANSGGVRRGELPIAEEVRPEPTYEQVVAFVGREFRISNIDWVGAPDWERWIL